MSAAAHVVLRLFAAVAPLLLTVVLAWLVMEDYLCFGGGEKEIFLAVPLLMWSLVYLLCYLALWWRRFVIGRAVAVSSAIASGVVAVAWLALFAVSWLRYR